MDDLVGLDSTKESLQIGRIGARRLRHVLITDRGESDEEELLR